MREVDLWVLVVLYKMGEAGCSRLGARLPKRWEDRLHAEWVPDGCGECSDCQ
jgi:hypothetical protein